MNVTHKTINLKGLDIYQTIYLPEGSPKAVVQINHGLAEHSERYIDFANFLCSKGFAVYIHDHPGHGKSINEKIPTGHLLWRGGWDLMLDAIHRINKTIRKKHPQVAVFLLGHSMGSLLSRHYNATFPMYFKGMILSGTTEPDVATLRSLLTFIRMNRVIRKQTYSHKMLNGFFYKSYNRVLKNTRTQFDWLSSNPEEVDKYINDPLCGFPLSMGFFKNLSLGSIQMLKAEKNLKFRKNFSTLIISGQNDPVGNFGKDPKLVERKYINQGFYRTKLVLLEGRHELLNETEEIRMKTYENIISFFEDKLMGNF